MYEFPFTHKLNENSQHFLNQWPHSKNCTSLSIHVKSKVTRDGRKVITGALQLFDDERFFSKRENYLHSLCTTRKKMQKTVRR